jgi:hypothetical protein
LGRNYQKISNNKMINLIIFSPPYGEPQTGGGIAKKGYDGPKHTPTDLVGKRSYMPENLIFTKENIGSLKYVQKRASGLE